jgi:hypothetical protein
MKKEYDQIKTPFDAPLKYGDILWLARELIKIR